jgi:hypothetical protein
MNADFEMELASLGRKYRRPPAFEPINRRLAQHLLWLTAPGDTLILDAPPTPDIQERAMALDVELISPEQVAGQAGKLFTPWGWTPTSVRLGEQLGATIQGPSIDVVATVNSKTWSHLLENSLGIDIPGSALIHSEPDLARAVAGACPNPNDKWVIKSPFGFAARDRVLGRGPTAEYAQLTWVRRRLVEGETLIFQPWLDVQREYGVTLMIEPDGKYVLNGISDLQTNGAGTGKGYLLGRPVSPERLKHLEEIASIVALHLHDAGYYGPAGFDALEHSQGLHPLLEVNARYTMGFVAVAVEKSLAPSAPTFWSLK